MKNLRKYKKVTKKNKVKEIITIPILIQIKR